MCSYLLLFLLWLKLGFRLFTAIMVLACNLSLWTDFTACTLCSIQSLQKYVMKDPDSSRALVHILHEQWQSPLFPTCCVKVYWAGVWSSPYFLKLHGQFHKQQNLVSWCLVIIWPVYPRKCELWLMCLWCLEQSQLFLLAQVSIPWCATELYSCYQLLLWWEDDEVSFSLSSLQKHLF